MKKSIPLFAVLLMVCLSFCKNETPANNAEAQKAAIEEKEAVVLDSLSNDLDKDKAEIEAGVQKLEEGLKAIEQ